VAVASSGPGPADGGTARAGQRRRPGAVTALGEARPRARINATGRITSVTVQTWSSVPTLECELKDETGRILVAFLGRRKIAGIVAGAKMSVSGTVGERSGRLVVINPDYVLLSSPGAG
jgi:RecG-like helicase